MPALPLGFNVLSDLHVDQLRSVNLPRLLNPSSRAKYLLIAGDLGNPYHSSYVEFLRQASPHYEWIVLIAGNHDYYYDHQNVEVEQRAFGERLAQVRHVCATLPNVKFLEQESFVLPGTAVTVLGCTLWTNVLPQAEQAVERALNDYACIYNDGVGGLVTVADLRARHLESLAWLRGAIEAYESQQRCEPDAGARLIVLTHHLPSFKLVHPHYVTSPINSAYATELENDCLRRPVSLWVCGHTHYFRRVTINGVPCIVNPSGYVDEETGCQRGMVYTLE